MDGGLGWGLLSTLCVCLGRFCHVALDVPSVFPFIVFKLPLHRTKGITDGDIRIFMSVSFTMRTLRDEMGSRRGYLDANSINMTLATVFVRKFDDHPTVNDVGAEFLKALRQLPYTGF